jgi:hypothetical protein
MQVKFITSTTKQREITPSNLVYRLFTIQEKCEAARCRGKGREVAI